MPKLGRSKKVTMQNIWGVDSRSSQKSYRIRFRSTESSDGWATAFVPKVPEVHVEASAKRNMYNIVSDDEDIKVRIHLKADSTHKEITVPFRGKTGSNPGFKEMYEKSRALVREDKALNPSVENQREVPHIDMSDRPFDMEDDDSWDMPF